MSSYSYQPKVFRYKNGCCICKAKSSSSRFTSSQKYEAEFRGCFNLQEPRSGKICNACVLIFKRWKRLPDRHSRNWEHVVDSKDKQTRKSVKIRKKCDQSADEAQVVRKHKYLARVSRHDDFSDDQGLGDDLSGSSASSVSGEERLSEGSFSSVPNSLAPSPHPSHYHYEEDIRGDCKTRTMAALLGSSKRKQKTEAILNSSKKTQIRNSSFSEFVDLEYWKAEKICCGQIYRGEYGEVLIDPRFFKPCCPVLGLSSTNSTTSDLTLEDEGVESYDEDLHHPSVSTFFASRSPSESDLSGLNMLMQFSTALVI